MNQVFNHCKQVQLETRGRRLLGHYAAKEATSGETTGFITLILLGEETSALL